jgi:hypothetical protein
MLSLTPETPDQEEVLSLLRKADERSSSLYPSESRHGADVATLMGQGSAFLWRASMASLSAAAAMSQMASALGN